jgi:AGCS family alanine or glycine:cation symporter
MGVGTLAGTATAIAVGGPGAIFWMWVCAFFGICTKFSEAVLAVHYRIKNEKGEVLGGPFLYIERGMGKGWKWLAKVFAVCGALAAFGIGNMVQSNTASSALFEAFGVPTIVSGVGAAVLIGLVLIGGIKRIGAIAEKIIPALAIIMIVSALIIVIVNAASVPQAFGLIFSGAFTTQGAVGGFAGAGLMMAIRMGFARGVFSNEAGLGSAPIAHAAAKVDHPVKQGFWGAFEVFLDTHIMCTLIALVILTTDVWTHADGLSGAPLVIAAFSASFLGQTAGSMLTAVIIATFGFTTILGWGFYGEKCLEYLTGAKTNMFYRIAFIPVVIVGSTFSLNLVWDIADVLNGMMIIPNMIGLIALGSTVKMLTKSYFNNETYTAPSLNK